MGATSGRGAGKGKDAKAVRISGYQNVFSEWNVVAPKIPPGLRMRLQSKVSVLLVDVPESGYLPASTASGLGIT